jgi:hypothetical protein
MAMAECDTSRTLLLSARAHANFCDKRTRISTRCLFLFSPGSFSWLSDLDKVLYTEAMAIYVCCGRVCGVFCAYRKSSRTFDAQPFSAIRLQDAWATNAPAGGRAWSRAFRHRPRQVISISCWLGFPAWRRTAAVSSDMRRKEDYCAGRWWRALFESTWRQTLVV